MLWCPSGWHCQRGASLSLFVVIKSDGDGLAGDDIVGWTHDHGRVRNVD